MNKKQVDLPEQVAETTPNAQEVKQLTKGAQVNLLRSIANIQFSMDFLRSPEDAMLTWKPDKYSELYKKRLTAICKIIADETGANLEEILNPETRTPEQQQRLLEISGVLQVKRIKQFLNSNYMQALESLKTVSGIYNDPTETDPESEYISVKEISVMIFFALNEDIKPDKPGNLTENQLKEIHDIFLLADKFHFDVSKKAPDQDGNETLESLIEWICNNYQNADKKKILEKIETFPVDLFKFPVDKVNSSIFDNKDDISQEPIAIPLKAEPDKSKRPVTNNVYLWLDELEDNTAIKRLTQYDLRVYMAIGNLYRVGNRKISIKDIYKTMGNQRNPAQDQRKKILLAIEKMSSIRITIDTSEEEQAGYNYPNLHIKRRNLIYTKVDVVLKRGQETEVIELMEEPVLFQFAISRDQYTTLPAVLLCSPISKTETQLAIENYLIHRITERGKGNKTILLSTVYEKAGITEKKQRQRAKNTIKDLLDYYKQQGFIFDYAICMNDNKAKQEECIKIKQA